MEIGGLHSEVYADRVVVGQRMFEVLAAIVGGAVAFAAGVSSICSSCDLHWLRCYLLLLRCQLLLLEVPLHLAEAVSRAGMEPNSRQQKYIAD
ncbi:hypothetical protein DUZ99_02940 [Xylanibacillus composti]|uniref:Uncharacterized protein n=1 Tax=Xylanibacillus composti TaxID=1572762 RepID=A0A8J4M187_9BACL|nr:hypothetical protein [Xylanibacillus composti]GIQ67835.1 hypothetical protein XYCOK13_06590 [Xylanibacillus composti]